MKTFNGIKVQGYLVIQKIADAPLVKTFFYLHNKINNNLKRSIGDIICNKPGVDRINTGYINEMRIYGVIDPNEIPTIPVPTADDDLPPRNYISKSLGAGLISTPNIVSGTNQFSAVVYNDDKLNGNDNFYITDLVLVVKNTTTAEDKVWARVLAPSDASSAIGLYKTPSVTYRIDWYIVFNQE